MDRVDIPQINKLFESVKIIDWTKRYADMLAQYRDSPCNIMSLPLPIFVLRDIAYNFKYYITANTPLSGFINCLKDIAYIASTSAPKKKTNANTERFQTTFTTNELSDAEKMTAELQRRMKNHQSLIFKLQELQQNCWTLNEQYKRRSAAKTTYILTKGNLKLDPPREVWVKMCKYRQKARRSQTAYEQAKDQFLRLYEEERRARTALIELQDEIHQTFRASISGILHKMKVAMMTTIDNVEESKSYSSYQKAKARIQELSEIHTADTVIHNCSKVYCFPDTKEFLRNTGFLEKLPSFSIEDPKENSAYDIDVQLRHSSSSQHLVSEKVGAAKDTDIENYNDNCYLKTTEDVVKSSNPRFLTVTPSDTLKQKLILMEGKIVFGWSRKGKYGVKTWGFCYAHQVTRVAE